jgi:hypothetical protein
MGSSSHSISPDNYVLAAINIYLVSGGSKVERQTEQDAGEAE